MGGDPVNDVIWMVRGAWVTMTLRGSCALGVFDLLDQPRSSAGVAQATGADQATVERLLRLLVDLGLVERRDDDSYANSPTGDVLRIDHPSHVRDLAMMQSWLPNISAWSRLEDAVRSGGGVYEAVNGMPSWEHLSHHPEIERQFNAAMARRSAAQVEAVLAGIELDGVRTVVDVGGGRGAMLAGVLEARPGLTGVVADRPEVAADAETAFAASGLGDRAHGVGADFFESVPVGADLYFLSNVLHDWDDERCVAILGTIREAMGDGSRLVIVEKLLDADGRSFEQTRDLHLLDLHMLVMFGGRERTRAQYDGLLTRAGLPPSGDPFVGQTWDLLETRR
jgi:hypothetical protein